MSHDLSHEQNNDSQNTDGQTNDSQTNDGQTNDGQNNPSQTNDGQNNPSQTNDGQTNDGQTNPSQTNDSQNNPSQTSDGQNNDSQTSDGQTNDSQTNPSRISIIGLPNAGKSTLINHLSGQYVSIVCRKAQTTRFRTNSIVRLKDKIVTIIDTPGALETRANRPLEKIMRTEVWQAADILIILIDAARGLDKNVLCLIRKAQGSYKHILIALNKIDKIKSKATLLVMIDQLSEQYGLKDIFLISALNGLGLERLEEHLYNIANTCVTHSDEITEAPKDIKCVETQISSDQKILEKTQGIPLDIWIGEIIRQTILHYMHQEIPYDVWVESSQWNKRNSFLVMYYNIHVSNARYRPIMLGHKGAAIKRIRVGSQERIKRVLGCECRLFLQIKVSERWDSSQAFLRYMDRLRFARDSTVSTCFSEHMHKSLQEMLSKTRCAHSDKVRQSPDKRRPVVADAGADNARRSWQPANKRRPVVANAGAAARRRWQPADKLRQPKDEQRPVVADNAAARRRWQPADKLRQPKDERRPALPQQKQNNKITK